MGLSLNYFHFNHLPPPAACRRAREGNESVSVKVGVCISLSGDGQPGGDGFSFSDLVYPREMGSVQMPTA